MKIIFSIIIPIRKENDYLRETLSALKKQTLKNFEVLVITDQISTVPDPSFKRNLGAQKAKGEYLCFLDDDSYPKKNWLQNIQTQINKHPDFAAFCGPCLTPPSDNLTQQASGLFWSSFMGSGGAGQYRNIAKKARFVDDYPTVNLIVKKSIFQKIGGFNSKYWPGEDTILCLDLINDHQKIFYHPSIVVFHHRRSVLIPHLKQISRYALHRGLFAKKFPKNSLKIGYFMPSLFLIYLLTLPFHHFYYPLYLYIFLLLITFTNYLLNYSSIQLSFLATFTIPLTHLYYGLLFIIGLLRTDLTFTAHPVDKQTGKYLGG